MNTIILKEITLTDWSSLTLRVNFNNGQTIIRGANELGKTSIIYAHRWLWCGRVDAVHPANYEIFDSRNPITKDTPEAVVTEVIEANGAEYTITKKAKAAFTKRNGEYVKASSDKYTILVDNIEFTATQFNDWIEDNICPIKQLPFCLDGSFFSSLCEDDKKKARFVLQEIVGEIKPEDFTGDYSIIKDMLIKYDVDQIRESASRKKKKLEERATEIENILKVKNADLSERKLVDYDKIASNIDSKKSEIEDVDKDMLGLNETIKPILDEKTRILDEITCLKTNRRLKRREYDEAQDDSLNDIRKEIADIDKENRFISAENEGRKIKRENCNKEIERLEDLLSSQQRRIQRLRDARDEWKSKVFTESRCPVCGQELPIDKLENAKAKFNEDVRSHIHEIAVEGHSLADSIKSTEEQIKSVRTKINAISEDTPLRSKEELTEKYNKAYRSLTPFEDTDHFREVTKKIEDLEKSIPEIPSVDSSELVHRKHILMEELEGLQQQYGGRNEIKRLQNDICELMTEQDDNGCAISEQEMIVDKCKEWIEEKANIISHRINDKLANCSIQMFSIQKNGEQTPDCVILDKRGVKYGKTNTAERIKIDVELQNLFMKHYGVSLITMIDECAVFSSFNIPKIESQSMLIFASDDKKLIVE